MMTAGRGSPRPQSQCFGCSNPYVPLTPHPPRQGGWEQENQRFVLPKPAQAAGGPNAYRREKIRGGDRPSTFYVHPRALRLMPFSRILPFVPRVSFYQLRFMKGLQPPLAANPG